MRTYPPDRSGHSRRRITLPLAPAAVAALLGVATLGGIAQAQQPQSPQGLEEVVVTGSRIVRRDFEANSPITTIDQALIENTMSVGIEKVLNQLPQFVPAVSQFVTGDVQSTATNSPGSSTLSLRGLGANRNLVLIDGRRAMPVNATMAIDINTIPSAMVERVETITGGASSVYGADAVAGVVNFILKKNFEGVDFDTRYGTTMDGGGDELRLTGLFGSNFSDGKGNVMLGFEYDSRGKVLQADRSFYRDGWADPNTGASFFGHAEPYYQTEAGNLPTQAAIDAAFPGHAVAAVGTGQGYYWNYDDGSLYKRTADGTYNYHGPTVVNGLQYREIRTDTSPGAAAANTLVQNEVEALASIPFTRYAVFGRAHLNLTDHLEAVVQANFSQDETRTLLGDNWALSFWAAPVPHGDRIYAPSVDTSGNTYPDYLTGGAKGLNCPAVGGCTVSQAWPTPAALQAVLDSRPNREADWYLGDTTDYIGKRTEDATNVTYQLLAGFDGTFENKDWTWDFYVSHGATNLGATFGGFLSLERYRYLLYQPNYGRDASAIGNAYGGRVAGVLNCTTGLPIAESFTPSEDCVDGVKANLQNQSTMEQNIAEFNLQGKMATMPAGDARFAVGADYRWNSYKYNTDILSSQQSFIDGVIGLFPANNASGETSVKELYGELLLPLLSGKKAAQALNLELGYRASDNNPSGTVDTYKALLDWAPTSKVRFRGGHQVANRAPNIGELFLSKTQTVVFNVFGDPCSTSNFVATSISANPANPNAAQVRAICELRDGTCRHGRLLQHPAGGRPGPRAREHDRQSALKPRDGRDQHVRRRAAAQGSDLVVDRLLGYRHQQSDLGAIGGVRLYAVLLGCVQPGVRPERRGLPATDARYSNRAVQLGRRDLLERSRGPDERCRHPAQLGNGDRQGQHGAQLHRELPRQRQDTVGPGNAFRRIQRHVRADPAELERRRVRLPDLHDADLLQRQVERVPALDAFAEHRVGGCGDRHHVDPGDELVRQVRSDRWLRVRRAMELPVRRRQLVRPPAGDHRRDAVVGRAVRRTATSTTFSAGPSMSACR